ncbi:MAG: imidazole glycerol phosphate synthase subunit HisH, partial [bacterium]|nr:imidazole glycerol phosphate synthase subunit HisH [bacterium]
HSYYVEPAERDVVGGETEYGVRYCSVLWRGEMYGTQFHPEKSQRVGMRMLKNFVERVKAVGVEG